MLQHRATKFAVIAALVAMASVFGVRARAQSNPYRVVEGWGSAPADRPWGGITAIDKDRQGNLWIFERCGGNSCAGSDLAPIIKLDPSGKVLASIGAGMFVFPHDIYVDADGNIWAVDSQGKDGKGHVVVKFSPDGKVLMTLGKPGVPGDGPDTFNQPVGVVTAPNGDIFVADGHSPSPNSRVVKFSKDGKFIKAWGKKGSGPGDFDGVHCIAMDSKGRLFVGDRGNNRFEIFDQDGKLLDTWKQFGRPGGLYIDKSDTMYASDPESNPKLNPSFKRGVRIGSARDGKVTGYIPGPEPKTEDQASEGVENVVTDAQGNLYTVEVAGKRLRKMVKSS